MDIPSAGMNNKPTQVRKSICSKLLLPKNTKTKTLLTKFVWASSAIQIIKCVLVTQSLVFLEFHCHRVNYIRCSCSTNVTQTTKWLFITSRIGLIQNMFWIAYYCYWFVYNMELWPLPLGTIIGKRKWILNMKKLYLKH